MDVIESRVSFFRMFKQRGFQLFSLELDKQFDINELSQTLFRDSQLKNNFKLILREPQKVKLGPDGEPLELSEEDEDDEEGGEDEMMEEGGEDELIEMLEEGEAEMLEGDIDAEDDKGQDGEAQDKDKPEDEKKEEEEVREVAQLGAIDASGDQDLISKNGGQAGAEGAQNAPAQQDATGNATQHDAAQQD